jgi:membrane-bound ClpP family serine protease
MSEPTLNLRGFAKSGGISVITVVVYVASIGAAAVVLQFVNWGPAASAVAWIGLISVGPALLALRIGLPAFPTIVACAALAALYYVVISLSSNTYDTDQWNYSHLRDGLFVLSVQAIVAVGAVVAARWWRRYRGTEFSPAASHLKYRTR